VIASEARTSFGAELIRLAAENPDRPALTCGDDVLSRGQLVARAEALALAFAELGVVHRSLVAIVLPNSPEFLEAMLAACWLGATPQPISPQAPRLERDQVIELANPALVVGRASEDDGSRPAITAAQIRAIVSRASKPVGARELEPLVAPAWKALTSGGSTGRPKLIVALAPALVEATAGPLGPLLRLPRDGTVLAPGPLTHNAPFVITIVGLLLGNHVILMPRFDAAEALELVEAHRVTWLYVVPTMMLRIWRLPGDVRLGRDLASLATVYHMAAPCPPWLKRAWINWLGPDRILELYGATELQALTVVTGREWLAHPGTVGRVVIGQIEVRDSDGAPLPPGRTGELWQRRGAAEPAPYRYIGATARSADDSWESVGDMGYLDEDGYLYLADRKTDMILVGGENIYPAEIEAALDEYPAVRSSCVIGLPDEDLGNALHAIVELAYPASDEDLIAHLRMRLSPRKLPRTIERTQRPLRDEAGKMRRSALRAERIASKTLPV